MGGAALVWVVTLVRLVGLRSFSKMTSFDFVMTVAMGSLVAGAAQDTKALEFLQTMAAMAGLFMVQLIIAVVRKKSDWFEDAISNDPCILMRDGKINEEALSTTRVSRSDLLAKLREANVLSFEEVRAVVLETTGDISVLHGEKLDDALIENMHTFSDGKDG
ncbi:DUF421 domain-containing protein [Alteriqipengyuania flavescens]|uniref:DUF421 domain-containing protein n=1 Tax=Alteriqipengyuania flavescens TaxID=3053610 RepID=UPI0025B54335|nr:YetF domain-containing protein [Alteriqipengyuania flavescens]WJY18563.1 DUF421 domain-containing protein [Alteriqipengyuania flavescens]WJY24503.1 DUF421 domain-containing protein [Alteriqipengyuania flavescens]